MVPTNAAFKPKVTIFFEVRVHYKTLGVQRKNEHSWDAEGTIKGARG